MNRGARVRTTRGVLWVALLALTAAPDAGAAAWWPRLEGGRVRWCERACLPDPSPGGGTGSPRDTLAHDPGRVLAASGDTLGAWAARAADALVPAVALREYARACLARGLEARADSVLASPRLAASPWAWDAVRARAELAVARGDTVLADSLLSSAATALWPDGERAALSLSRARLSAARGDPERAADIARATLRRYPALGPSGGALALLDSLARSRGESLAVADERAGAESEVLRGARGSALRRLRHLRARVEPAERWQTTLRLAEVLRGARQPRSAFAAAESAAAHAPPGLPRLRVALERARALRDAGATDSALSAFASIGRSDGPDGLRSTAWWEAAREAEDQSRWTVALAGLREVARLGGSRADEACVRAGLAEFARGERDSARSWWRRSRSEAARFWLGVALRSDERTTGDSLLATVAILPGYSFYRSAARETLGVTGWRHTVAEPVAADSGAGLVRWDDAWGLGDDEMRELAAKLAGHEPAPAEWLDAAGRAFRLGRTAQGTRWAERAFTAASESRDDSLAWAIAPWAYPPAFESEVAAAESLGIERALLWALLRQESRFDPRARSRSDALGLAQLKLSTAGDVARWLREPQPTEAGLFAPDTSIRFGARYLARLRERFGDRDAVALAAYNAGPSTIRRDWRELIERGGEALFAEFASNSDSQDYARRILGFRQAYRELRPTSAP
ncbi:MAG: lytic transglycosylase domain-containing protein [Candidatus Eisenbacteria bacterium]|nr:lytic transglycosylase domain-containing protein [Candidatus Eisenbacteria bacterium]